MEPWYLHTSIERAGKALQSLVVMSHFSLLALQAGSGSIDAKSNNQTFPSITPSAEANTKLLKSKLRYEISRQSLAQAQPHGSSLSIRSIQKLSASEASKDRLHLKRRYKFVPRLGHFANAGAGGRVVETKPPFPRRRLAPSKGITLPKTAYFDTLNFIRICICHPAEGTAFISEVRRTYIKYSQAPR